MNRSGRAIRLTILLICFLYVKTYPSTNKTQTYVSKTGLPFREARSVSSLQSECSGLLFAQQMEDSVKVERADSIKLKDPNMAILYAVVPGIIIHGAGHFYAGKHTTAAILLASGFIGGSLVFIGGLTGFERGSPTETGYVLIITGAIFFTGSWTYDVIGAPLAVQKQNRKLLGKKSAEVKFEFDHKYDSIRVVLVRRF